MQWGSNGYFGRRRAWRSGPGNRPLDFALSATGGRCYAAGVADTLLVNEIFLSVQGESTFAGLPCVFVRLTGCPLRCSYCDSAYAFHGGRRMVLDHVLGEVAQYATRFPLSGPAQRLPLVEITGGEPLVQRPVFDLMRELCDRGFTVLLETSGAVDIAPVDHRVRRIMDLKCPSSGEAGRNLWSNVLHLRATDEVKFVIATREDYAWTKQAIAQHALDQRCPLLVSWASPLTPGQQDVSLKPIPPGQTPIGRRELVEALLRDALPVRFQLQMHKFIWPPDQTGV